MPQLSSVRVSVSAISAALRKAGCVFAEEEAQMLISQAATDADLELMIGRRVSGVPLEQILGWAEFCNYRVLVEPQVFVPRYKSEFLVSQALTLCRPDSLVLDLCCGSGAMGLAMKSSISTITLLASDLDPIAVHCARQNLDAIGATVFEGDLFDPLPKELKGKIDVLVANAPYVPTHSIELMPRESRIYETRISLDGGVDGLDVHRRIAASATEWLAPGGSLLIETAHAQATIASDFFKASGLQPKITYSDEFDASVVIGKKP